MFTTKIILTSVAIIILAGAKVAIHCQTHLRIMASKAIAAFETYFDLMYGKDPELTAAFDEIYKEYKAGNDIYLGCFCKPKSCHGDVLAKKLQENLIKEKMKEKRSEK